MRGKRFQVQRLRAGGFVERREQPRLAAPSRLDQCDVTELASAA